jgi:hypothetical protein
MPNDSQPTQAASQSGPVLFHELMNAQMALCHEKQMEAGKRALEFLEKECFTTDAATGELRPVLKRFPVNRNGKLVYVAVPVATLVTLPSLEVTKARVVVRPATQAASGEGTEGGERREYEAETQFEIGQAPLPAGIANLVAVLTGSVCEVGEKGQLELSPHSMVVENEEERLHLLQATLKDAHGVLVPDVEVAFAIEAEQAVCDSLMIQGAGASSGAMAARRFTGKTSANGTADVLLKVVRSVPAEVRSRQFTVRAVCKVPARGDAQPAVEHVALARGSITMPLPVPPS